MRSIQVEIRGLAAADSYPWESKAKDYEEKINKFLQDVEWAENSNTGSAAQGSSGQSGANPDNRKKTIDEMTTGDITKHALRVQDKTQESTQRAKKALDETIEVHSIN